LEFTQKEFLNAISKKALNGNISIFLGAGISIDANYPSWKTLLEPCAEQLEIDISSMNNLFLLAQYYVNKFGEGELKNIINQRINRVEYESKIVTELLNLHFESIWTTNYDKVIEKNLDKKGIVSNSIFDEKDLLNVDLSNRINIYKLNGDISNLDNIVVTKNDMENYEKNHEMFLTFLKRELISNTFIFLGYSFQDSIILNCLNKISECLGKSSICHYAIMPKNDIDKNYIEDLNCRYNIKVITVEEYNEIPKLLRTLNHKIRERNIFVSGSYETLNQDETLFANELCKELAIELLSNNFKILTGLGKNLGHNLTGNSVQYLLEKGVLNIEKNLVMRPLGKLATSCDKKSLRTKLIRDSNITIFVFGERSKTPSIGVMEEFEIAKQNRKKIIPLGITGYASLKIWKEINANITLYPYLEEYIDILKNERNTKKLIKTVMSIIKDINNSHN
jgi:hypothetical protein